MFRMSVLVEGLDLPWLLDIADDLDDGTYWLEDGEGWQEQLASCYFVLETYHDE